MDIIEFNGCFRKGGVVIKLLWLVVLKICYEKLATMSMSPSFGLEMIVFCYPYTCKWL